MALNLNVLGGELRACCFDPITGFYRDGSCRTGEEDAGTHVVCARMTVEFLNFSVERGNDLVTPRPQWRFKGLKPGDRWCLCAGRWREAHDAGRAPPVILSATHEEALAVVPLATLRDHALDGGR
jgi:uncharacterized protein (DUF2237 family)